MFSTTIPHLPLSVIDISVNGGNNADVYNLTLLYMDNRTRKHAIDDFTRGVGYKIRTIDLDRKKFLKLGVYPLNMNRGEEPAPFSKAALLCITPADLENEKNRKAVTLRIRNFQKNYPKISVKLILMPNSFSEPIPRGSIIYDSDTFRELTALTKKLKINHAVVHPGNIKKIEEIFKSAAEAVFAADRSLEKQYLFTEGEDYLVTEKHEPVLNKKSSRDKSKPSNIKKLSDTSEPYFANLGVVNISNDSADVYNLSLKYMDGYTRDFAMDDFTRGVDHKIRTISVDGKEFKLSAYPLSLNRAVVEDESKIGAMQANLLCISPSDLENTNIASITKKILNFQSTYKTPIILTLISDGLVDENVIKKFERLTTSLNLDGYIADPYHNNVDEVFSAGARECLKSLKKKNSIISRQSVVSKTLTQQGRNEKATKRNVTIKEKQQSILVKKTPGDSFEDIARNNLPEESYNYRPGSYNCLRKKKLNDFSSENAIIPYYKHKLHLSIDVSNEADYQKTFQLLVEIFQEECVYEVKLFNSKEDKDKLQQGKEATLYFVDKNPKIPGQDKISNEQFLYQHIEVMRKLDKRIQELGLPVSIKPDQNDSATLFGCQSEGISISPPERENEKYIRSEFRDSDWANPYLSLHNILPVVDAINHYKLNREVTGFSMFFDRTRGERRADIYLSILLDKFSLFPGPVKKVIQEIAALALLASNDGKTLKNVVASGLNVDDPLSYFKQKVSENQQYDADTIKKVVANLVKYANSDEKPNKGEIQQIFLPILLTATNLKKHDEAVDHERKQTQLIKNFGINKPGF